MKQYRSQDCWTTEVNGVNPTAQSKPAAKQAIDDALKASESAIDSRTDLTDEEKAAAKADANAKADTAKQAIDAATTNVEVDRQDWWNNQHCLSQPNCAK